MNRKAWVILALLVAVNIAAFSFDSEWGPALVEHPVLAAAAQDSLLSAEPTGYGHWHEISDIPLEIAKHLGPWTVTATYTHSAGARSVIHRLDGRHYRIYEIDGSVFYQVWFGEGELQ